MARRGRPKKGETRIDEGYHSKLNHHLLNAFDREQYWIIPCDGGYCLYDRKREHRRANAQYIGRFYISTDEKKYVFNNDYYAEIADLIEAMDKYNATLPFSPEVYDPTYRKSAQIEMAIHDYLTNIGFEEASDEPTYAKYKISDDYGHKLITILVKVDFDTSGGKVQRPINDDSWQECPFSDLDSAIAACNSILAGYFSVVQAQMANALGKLTSSRAALVLDKTFDWKTLTTYSEDATQKAIEQMEDELKRLKGE